ncbi:hypothetical protein CK934_24540 [Chitinophaga sp. MD30]|nr:hypothetical protein CK934_24540 [Chitinophaga sp. MD30]
MYSVCLVLFLIVIELERTYQPISINNHNSKKLFLLQSALIQKYYLIYFQPGILSMYFLAYCSKEPLQKNMRIALFIENHTHEIRLNLLKATLPSQFFDKRY